VPRVTNLGQFKMNVHNGWPKSMFEFLKNHPNFFIMPHGGFWYHQMAPSQIIGI